MSHISIRVPWHDDCWNGCFCKNPSCNTYCRVLPRIAMAKDDSEDARAGKPWGEMPQEEWPACAGENGGFMSPHSYTRVFRHVYSKPGNRHAPLQPTPVVIPPYAALGVPFRYMSRSYQDTISEQHPEFSDDEVAPFNTAWLYGEARQREILSWFRSKISPGESLCVFYCKNGNPVDDDCQRMIVGLGEVTKVYPLLEYDSTAAYTYPMWEILFEHSIRPDLKKSKGFLLPYNQYLQISEEEIKKVTGLTKEEALDEIRLSLDKLGGSSRLLDELSYGCDYVSNHSMLIILEAARTAVEAVIRHKLVGGDWQLQLRWINDSVAKVKSMITPFPSFAEALKSIGINYSYLIEQDLRKQGCGKKDNPWLYFDKLLRGDLEMPDTVYTKELPMYRQTWEYLPDDAKQVLELLSRFEIPAQLIEAQIQDRDNYANLISNPYILSESCVQKFDHRITTQTIDIGVIVDPEIQGACIPQAPSVVETAIDKRRLRSLIIEHLCSVLNDGDTLISLSEMEEHLKQTLQNESNARLPMNILLTLRPFFSTKIAYIPEENPQALQLKEYYQMEEKLRSILSKRAAKGVKKKIDEDWEAIAKRDKNYDPGNERSVSATQQQIEALQKMAAKRLSVLTGGAGTGKTTVVRSFLSSENILSEGVLLLAPTGKARVRLGNMAQQRGIEAKTVAQFLMRQGRFDYDLMLPLANEQKEKYSGAKNVIIDECSMLTTRDLYVLLDAIDLAKVNRVILIGDPYQLPPIGAGRPFSDLCHFLLDPKNELFDAITNLTTVVRTISAGDSDVLTLASWYGGNKPRKNADVIFDKIENGTLDKDLNVYYWNNEDDLASQLQAALCSEFHCSGEDLGSRLKARMGMDDLSSLFHSPEKLECFQILTPVLNPVWGAYQLNDYVQGWLGNQDGNIFMQFSTQKIYPSDKVIQLKNEKRNGYPSGKDHQLSNGQIGFVKFIKENKDSGYCNITFAGIPDETIGYTAVKGEDSNTPFELAYAITIHKSQGSDFDTVLVVLPKSGRILSRELIYTALTRARCKVILLVQDNIQWLRELSKPQYSVLARRNSNLFRFSVRAQRASIPYVEGLIHSTKPDKNGTVLFVRSKSEVIIANELISAGLRFEYEKQIEEDGRRCIPDFSFVTDDGDTIIWEHLGMLGVSEYRSSWEKKRELYHRLGFVEGETLFTTEDHLNGSISTTEVLDVIEKIKDRME